VFPRLLVLGIRCYNNTPGPCASHVTTHVPRLDSHWPTDCPDSWWYSILNMSHDIMWHIYCNITRYSAVKMLTAMRRSVPQINRSATLTSVVKLKVKVWSPEKNNMLKILYNLVRMWTLMRRGFARKNHFGTSKGVVKLRSQMSKLR